MPRVHHLLSSLCLVSALVVTGCVETTVSEPVPTVQQPDWNQQPIFDASFGGGISPEQPPEEPQECPGMGWGPGCNDLLDSARNTADSIYSTMDYTSAASGGGDVFVSGEEQKIVRSYDGTTLAHKQSFSHPELTDPRALTYYRGELFVLEIGEIYVFDATSGGFKRRFTHPDQFTTTDYTFKYVAPAGIDAAWGELWVTFHGNGNGGGMTVLDAVTGSVKAVHLHQPKQEIDTVFSGCTDPVTAVMNLQACANKANGWASGARAASDWTDLATVPEEKGVLAQCRFIQRSDLTQPVPADTDFTFDPLSNDACDSTGPQDGVDAVWGMHWYLTVESASDGGPLRVNEYGIETDRTKPWLTPLRRTWAPAQGAAGHPVRYDVAYQARETRIDWTGALKTKDWLRGTKCANYVVSDGDIFVTGKTGERWYEPARGFQKIELRFDGVLQDTKATASGQLCGNTASVPSGPRTVELRAYVNNGTRTLTATNGANFDNTAPTGVLNATPDAVRGAVTLTGSVTDDHSHPQRWRPQIFRGGSWQDLCDVVNTQPDQATYASSCTWNTASVPDGDYQLRIQAVDLSSDGGNVGDSPQRPVKVDNTLPALHETVPAIGSDVSSIVSGTQAELLLHQTDSGSGVDRSEVEYNVATDGSENGAWVSVGAPAQGGPHALTVWDTTDVQPGLHRMRARTSDRAGNVRTTEWQLVASQRRRGKIKCSTDGWEHCRAGFTGIGKETSFGGNTIIGGSGILGHINPPSSFPTSTSPGWTINFFTLVGAKGGEPFLEAGVANGTGCGDANLGWFVFGVWTPPYGKAEDQIYACIMDRDGNPLQANSRREYRAVLGTDKRARMYYEEGGKVRIAMIRNQNSYLAASRGAYLQAYGETNTHGRQLSGSFSAVRYNPNPPGGSFGAPPESDKFDSANGYGLRSHYSSVGNDARYFCVHGPRRACQAPSP